MNGSNKNPNKFRFLLYVAPVDPETGRTVRGLRRLLKVFRTYDKASIGLERMYLNEMDGGQTFWIEDRLKTRRRRT